MCMNKSHGIAGASPCYDFSFAYLQSEALPVGCLPSHDLPSHFLHGVIRTRWPVVGKTPALIVMGLALGRHHLKRLGAEGVPS